MSTELALTAGPPPVPVVAESDLDDDHAGDARLTVRHKFKRRALTKKSSISDFEQGYAANAAAPRYPTRKRLMRQTSQSTRIPGPANSSLDSHPSSRPTSPDPGRRTAKPTAPAPVSRGISPPGRAPATPGPSKVGKPRIPGRTLTKERPAATRTVSTSAMKGTMRRTAAATPGSKVSNIARHFERISKDNDRANRRYAVIRGRRARPVASARATVEVFDSVKDAIKDDSDPSDSSSEADDEDEGDGEGDNEPRACDVDTSAPSSAVPATSTTDNNSTGLPDNAQNSTDVSSETQQQPPTSEAQKPVQQVPEAVPFSPTLPTMPVNTATPSTPVASDVEFGPSMGDRQSTIMKALSGFLPQPLTQALHRLETEPEDEFMSDPEHIFRDASMVVRTDEPTSIIALALK